MLNDNIIRNILIVLVLVFSSCVDSSDYGEREVGNETYFNPPTWIQGVWINETNTYEGFKFTKNDFIIGYYDGSNGVSFNQRINDHGQDRMSCKEEISSKKYKITENGITGRIRVYDFISISDNEVRLDYYNDGVNYPEGTIDIYVLKKQ